MNKLNQKMLIALIMLLLFSSAIFTEVIYATWNPDDKYPGMTLSNGNLTVSGAKGWTSVRATVGVSSGKWYWEVSFGADADHTPGVGTLDAALPIWPGNDAYGWGYYFHGSIYHDGSGTSYGVDYGGTSTVIGTALDMDNGKIWWSVNGVWQSGGDPVTGINPAFNNLTGEIYPMHSVYWGYHQATANFGQNNFVYAAPEGFYEGLAQIDNVPEPSSSLLMVLIIFSSLIISYRKTK